MSAAPAWWWLDPALQPSSDAADDAVPFVLPGTGAAQQYLAAIGAAPGQRIGLAIGTDPIGAALIAAAPLLGLTAVLLHHRLTRDELAAHVSRARLDRLIAHPAHPAADLPEAQATPEEFALGTGTVRIRNAFADPSFVLFTSGTSGVAKLARLPVRAVRRAALAAIAHLDLRAQDGWLCPLPLSHIGGAATVIRAGLCGHRLCLVERFDAEQVNALIDEQPITGASLVPTQLFRLVQARGAKSWPARLRCLAIGGGPLDADLIRRCTALGLAPSQTYGLTEACSQVATLRPQDAAAHPGSAGTALPGVGLRIRVGAEVVPAGTLGQIEVAGPTLFSGYERDGEVVETPGAWFPTGDLGTLDAAGFLTVHCRREDLILSGGENVYPAEVEAVLAAHEDLAEVAVVGIPDAEWGQVVGAVLVLRPEAPAFSDPAFHAWLAERLAGFKRPRRWRVVDALPRTAMGKVHRAALPALFAPREVRYVDADA